MSEIAVTQCWIDPFFAPTVAGDICYPGSTKEQDAIQGKWVRVERNINSQAWGMMSLVSPSPTKLCVFTLFTVPSERILSAHAAARRPARHRPAPPSRERNALAFGLLVQGAAGR